MWKNRQFRVGVTIAAFALIGVVGCQTAGSRFAFVGNPTPAAKTADSRTVSHTSPAEERVEESFQESPEAARLSGTSISNIKPGRTPAKKRPERKPGPGGPFAGNNNFRSY